MDQEICLLLKTDTSSPLGPKRRVSCGRGRRHRRTRRLTGVDVSFPPLLSLSAGPAADTAQHFGWAGVGGWAGLQKKFFFKAGFIPLESRQSLQFCRLDFEKFSAGPAAVTPLTPLGVGVVVGGLGSALFFDIFFLNAGIKLARVANHSNSVDWT